MNNVYKVEKISNAREIGNISRSDIERISCKNSQTTYIGNETLICRVLSKYIFYCDSNDPGITPHLSLDGYWESWITIAMARTIRKGWKCIDIGANHGYFSVLMADAVGPSGNVLAIEPNPRLVQMLERTLSVNGFDSNTIVLQKAISNTNNQKAKLFIPRNHGINATILTQELKTDDEVIEIETITLDDLTKDWDRVDFIKIDAEGAEELIWQGMQKVLNENKNITIVLEINCSRYAQPKEFLQEIQANGFKLRHIDYDSQIKDLTIEECLNSRVGDDWMLFLQRE